MTGWQRRRPLDGAIACHTDGCVSGIRGHILFVVPGGGGARSGASALTRGSGRQEEPKWDLRVIKVLSDFIKGPGNASHSPDDDSTHPSPAPARQGVEQAGHQGEDRARVEGLPVSSFVTRAGLCSRTSGDRRLGREPKPGM